MVRAVSITPVIIIKASAYDNWNTTCHALLGCGGYGDAAFCRNIGIWIKARCRHSIPRFLADILQNAKTPTSGNQRGHCGNAKWRERLTLEWMVSQPPPQYISNPSPPFSVSGECVRLYNSCISTSEKKNETTCLANLLIITIKMVPPGRLELPRHCWQQILSLPRLPIPPQGHRVFYLYIKALSNRTGTDGRIRFAPV